MIKIDPPSRLSNTAAAALSKRGLARFLNRARGLVGLGEVDALLTGDAELKRLNRAYRGMDRATDVLSFRAAEEMPGGHAGDLAVSLETAARQAERYGHSLREEVSILLLHGVLHLAGMDHETDGGEMEARERELRRELRLPASLIERMQPVRAKVSRRSAR